MNNLQIFNYKETPVRTIERDGEIWWVLKDICGALEIVDSKSVPRRLDADEVDKIPLIDGKGAMQETYIISEPGLYNVILRSNKPEAKDFKRWVTHDVLPAIRRTGSYSMIPAPRQPALPDVVTFSSAVGFMRLTRRVMLDMGASPFDVGMMIKQTCEAISFPVPPALSNQIQGQLDLFHRPGLEA